MEYRKALTEQFYQWEQRGRGWHLFESPVDLEPAFEPFFGHFVPGPIIDDGIRPSWWHRLMPGATTAATDSSPTIPDPPQPLAYESSDHGG